MTIGTRIIIITVALALALAAFFYHRYVVAGYVAEITALKGVYAQAQAKAVADALKINDAVLYEREVKHVEIYDAGKVAAVSIAKAESREGDVNIDGVVPVNVSDALLMQSERICGGGACGVATGGAVHSEASSGASGATR